MKRSVLSIQQYSMSVLLLYRNTVAVRRIKELEIIGKNYLMLFADLDGGNYVLVKCDDIKSILQVPDIEGVESLP